MATRIKTYLVMTALGAHKPSMVKQFTQHVASYGVNIVSTRMMAMGSEFGLMLLVEGSWAAIAKLETSGASLEKKFGLATTMRRAVVKNGRKKFIPYMMHAVTIDREGILNDLIQFFYGMGVNIEEVNSYTFFAQTGVRMASITIDLHIDSNVHIPTLRDKFIETCDGLNLDASLELVRD